MREVIAVLFEAFDGRQFFTAKECEEYEEKVICDKCITDAVESIRAYCNKHDDTCVGCVLYDDEEGCPLDVANWQEVKKK